MGDKEEKGTRTQGTGSQGNQGPSTGDEPSANAVRANPDKASSFTNYIAPDPDSTDADVRGGRQGGGAGYEQGGKGSAVGGAFGKDPDFRDNPDPNAGGPADRGVPGRGAKDAGESARNLGEHPSNAGEPSHKTGSVD